MASESRNRNEENKMHSIIKKIGIFFSICVALTICASLTWAEPEIVFTHRSADFFGYSETLKKGDVITVYDPDGVFCGKCVVKEDGRYGFLHVYGDDPTTTDIDEGANTGDTIIFFVNDVQTVPKAGQKAVWTEHGSVRIDF